MMRANPYDRVPYRTFPRRQTHPERLATVAALFGMAPAPVARCRVLEIGCGSGGNLIPLAYALPGARFTGIDLAAAPLAAARAMAEALGLSNLELRHGDMREFEHGGGEFDYILAHGVYSWVPEEVRDGLLRVCRARLAPEGAAFVSYNAYPGHYERQMLREILLRRGGTVRSARRFLGGLPHEEAAALAASPDDILFHDILAPVNHAVWFGEFTAHAAAHGLRYLGEADLHEMFDARGRIADEDAEPELDFRKLRRFRQTLLCRAEVTLARAIAPQQMDGFLFSKNPHGRRVPGEDAAVEAVAQALDDVYPLPVEFGELAPYAGSAAALREILAGLIAAGCADPHVYGFPCCEAAGERPRASRLARLQAASGRLVTSLCHMTVELDEPARQLLLLLDGRRRRETIVRRLAGLAGAPPAGVIRRALPASLEWLAGIGLLEG